MPDISSKNRRRLGIAFFALFALAIVMGPGPGVYLVNPDPADAGAARFFLGMPVIYVWTVFWFGIQALAVVLSYFFLWRKSEA